MLGDTTVFKNISDCQCQYRELRNSWWNYKNTRENGIRGNKQKWRTSIDSRAKIIVCLHTSNRPLSIRAETDAGRVLSQEETLWVYAWWDRQTDRHTYERTDTRPLLCIFRHGQATSSYINVESRSDSCLWHDSVCCTEMRKYTIRCTTVFVTGFFHEEAFSFFRSCGTTWLSWSMRGASLRQLYALSIHCHGFALFTDAAWLRHQPAATAHLFSLITHKVPTKNCQYCIQPDVDFSAFHPMLHRSR